MEVVTWFILDLRLLILVISITKVRWIAVIILNKEFPLNS